MIVFCHLNVFDILILILTMYMCLHVHRRKELLSSYGSPLLGGSEWTSFHRLMDEIQESESNC